MLTIYSKDVSFDRSNSNMFFDSLGYGILIDTLSDALITEELNGSYILEFDYKEDGKLSEYLIEENIIKANGEPFSIYSIKKTTEKRIKVLAKHWVINEWGKDFILDSAPTNLVSQSALSWIMARSMNQPNITVGGDCTNAASARYVRKNMLDAIFKEDNSILKHFGGELSYNKNTVMVNNHRGSNSGITIRQGKNLTGAEYYLDFSTVATRLVPVGKDGLMLDNIYVDSPLIGNYKTPIIKKVEVNTDNTADLTNYCNNLYSNGVDKPTISIKIDFIELSKTTEYKNYSNLESAHLGDEVTAYIPSINLNINTRIVKTVYNDNLNRITELELGSVTPNISSTNAIIANEVSKIPENNNSILEEAKEDASQLIKHPFGGYIYIDENSGNMYIMDSTDINSATNVWKWGLGGLGFSSTGINGTYDVAMTQDGKIVADFIKTGVLDSITIKAYDGIIGGYKIGSDRLYAETYAPANFTNSDLTKVSNYIMGTGTLTPQEIELYDINDDGVVNSADYILIKHFINLGITTNKSAKIIMQTGNTIFDNAYILQDGNGNDILNFSFNGIKHNNNGSFEVSGSNLKLTDANNNSVTLSPSILPTNILNDWYSTNEISLSNAKKHKLLIIMGRPSTSAAITSLVIPTDILSTSNTQFQFADESNYVSFNLRYNSSNIIIGGTGRSSNGYIVSAYTMF